MTAGAGTCSFEIHAVAEGPAAELPGDAHFKLHLWKFLQSGGGDTEPSCSCFPRDTTKMCQESSCGTGSIVAGSGKGPRTGLGSGCASTAGEKEPTNATQDREFL